jgi:hypothetical protein
LDYLAALEYCKSNGATTVVVDSMSHEHEGPGGVLEQHAEAVDRLSRGDPKRAGAVTMLAWSKPKAARRKLINSLLQLGMNVIFCFRAKEKLKLPDRGSRDREPTQLGWMPIAGDEFVYEMTTRFLLPPQADGVPQLTSDYPGEREVIKIPSGPTQLTEDIGEKMARWAAGDSVGKTAPQPTPTEHDDPGPLLDGILSAQSVDALKAAAAEVKRGNFTESQKQQFRAAYQGRMAELQG